jgi:hypothetical protein
MDIEGRLGFEHHHDKLNIQDIEPWTPEITRYWAGKEKEGVQKYRSSEWRIQETGSQNSESETINCLTNSRSSTLADGLRTTETDADTETDTGCWLLITDY